MRSLICMLMALCLATSLSAQDVEDQVAPEAAQKIRRTAAKWAVIGVATSVATAGLTIGATLANGTLDPDSPAFAQLLAAQVSSVIIDTFIAVLDVLVVIFNFARLGAALAVLAVIEMDVDRVVP